MIEVKNIGKVGGKPQKWIDVCGYVMTQTDLANIFEINLISLRARIASGWPIAAALVVPCSNTITVGGVIDSSKLPAYEHSMIMTLYRYFKYPTKETYDTIIQGVK